MSKVALAMIVKNDAKELELLERCLENVLPYVDRAFITVTHKKEQDPFYSFILPKLAQNKVETNIFEWVNDFSAARNFNFSQVPKEYDYILWADSDDVFRGMEKLKDIMDKNPTVDAFAMNYLYDFDEHKTPIVVHKKTMIVRNDGCVEWTGRLHEDFKENRQLNVLFVKDIERLHLTTEERGNESKLRNVLISQEEAELNPEDPRVDFNLANSLMGAGEYKRAEATYKKFISRSGSEEEKYVVYQRLSGCIRALGGREEAIRCLQIAIGMEPDLPDARLALGYLYFELGMLDKAEEYILRGLEMRPQYHKMIVYNPRDYDYNPMMALSKVYYQKNRGDLALTMLQGCLQIYPESEYLKSMVGEMAKEKQRLEQAVEAINEIEALGDDKVGILSVINRLPKDLQAHPAVSRIRNQHLIKETSSGKDIAYFCGETTHTWNPEMAKTKGIGGSEEAVINLAKQWTKLGYNVTVYNSCGLDVMECGGVTYKPHWMYNPRDKFDITILWRHPALAEYELNTAKLFVDLHDVIPPGEFTEKRLKNINKVFVKTNAHRILFPNIPDEKIAVIPNGQDFELFKQKAKKDPMLLVNTSSPDRSLDALPKLFKMVKERVPEAKCKWAYGWEIFDNAHATNRQMMDWKEQVVKEMEEAGIENLGRLSQKEAAKLYIKGHILAYPSEFYEIDCISVKKAQACGCVPITSDFAAFKESNKYGTTIPSKKTKDDWAKPYQNSFGIQDEEMQKAWVDAVVEELLHPRDTEAMIEWAKQFNWGRIATWWIDETFNPLKRELQTGE